MSRRNRREFARRVQTAVLSQADWRVEAVSGKHVLCASIGNLEIMRTTPDSQCRGMPADNGIDIWTRDGVNMRKVFSVWWSDGNVEDELEIVACATGDWDAPLFERLGH